MLSLYFYSIGPCVTCSVSSLFLQVGPYRECALSLSAAANISFELLAPGISSLLLTMIRKRTRPQVRARQVSQEIEEVLPKDDESQDEEEKIE